LSEGCMILHKVDDDYDDDWHYANIFAIEDGNIYFSPETPYWGTSFSNDKSEYTILWHEPQLFPDVSRVAIDKWLHISLSTYSPYLFVWTYELWTSNPWFPYNPTLPLMLQTDETKSQLISLFS
jgi:hypothetical protein